MTMVISVENLSKSYRLGQIGTGTFTNDLKVWWAKLRGKPYPFLRIGDTDPGFMTGGEILALDDVSFTVQQGEVLGIIGRNGAGKSTLLKILSRVTAPSSGRVRVRGRIASLLEVGTGFHPELTGRENIFLNGAILGMTKPEVARKFDEIVAFAEVEKFIDTPVKRYSSGMYVRLAFAVAAHLDPEILIVDEVLAVGDAEFQKKCLGKMGEVAQGGRTVLFVSHNMAAVGNLCKKGIVLNAGKIQKMGEISECISSYVVHQKYLNSWAANDPPADKELYFSQVSAVLEGEQPYHQLKVQMELRSTTSHKPAIVAVDISNSMGVVMMQALPSLVPFMESNESTHECEVTIQLPPLVPGRYSITTWVGSHNIETFDQIEHCVFFEVQHVPTKGRTFPYHSNHGFIVPVSTVTCDGRKIED